MRNRLFTVTAVLMAASVFSGTDVFGEGIFHRGEGSYEYSGYGPLAQSPVTLYYYIPESGDVTVMPILFSMHGTKRRGSEARDYWKDFAEHYGFIVLSPEFSKKYYDINAYNYGNVMRTSGEFSPNPQEQWTYNVIEAVFDFFKSETGNLSDRYDIWGHSAGGQFVHRFLLCMPQARVHRAVAANPGTWTMVIGEDSGYGYGWPYSIRGTMFDSEEYLRPFFAREFYVTVGDRDIDTESPDFPKYPEAMAQGPTRYARGKYFYKEARRTALSRGYPINWCQSVVKGASHSSRMMIYGSRRKIDGKLVYDIGDITHTAAFWLLYGDRFDIK
ncbi:MAG: hypothetical protein ACI3ZT_00095 [Candidatus Cryptobacteroides sp.]